MQTASEQLYYILKQNSNMEEYPPSNENTVCQT